MAWAMLWAMLWAWLWVESIAFALVPPAPLGPLAERDENASIYLTRYGYLHQTNTAGLVEDSQERNHQYRKALADFQAFADLPVTGVLDEATARLMKTPRCGVSDVIRAEDAIGDGEEEESDRLQRQRRYARQGSRWRVKQLSYRVDGAPPRSTASDAAESARAEVAAALRLWSDASALRFQQVQRSGARANLRLRFAKKAHGDGRPFDGAGGVLAHAFFPSSGGAVHFDGDEHWALNEADADSGSKKHGEMVSFRQAAAHELGHSLGLEHSRVRDALMSPFYRPRAPSVLHEDDVKGIQALYGPPPSSSGSNLSEGKKKKKKEPKGSKG